MSITEIVAIVLSIGAFSVSFIAAIGNALANRANAKVDYVNTLLSTINGLHGENKRLSDQLANYGNRLTEFQIVIDEREKRVQLLEASLRDATVGRAERAMYIQELENRVKELQARVDMLEKEVKRLETARVSDNKESVSKV